MPAMVAMNPIIKSAPTGMLVHTLLCLSLSLKFPSMHESWCLSYCWYTDAKTRSPSKHTLHDLPWPSHTRFQFWHTVLSLCNYTTGVVLWAIKHMSTPNIVNGSKMGIMHNTSSFEKATIVTQKRSKAWKLQPNHRYHLHPTCCNINTLKPAS